MAKKPKATLYVELDLDLKRRLDRLARHRGRKLVAEALLMVRRYLDEEEPKEKDLPPLDDESPPEEPPPAPRKRGK